MNPSNDTKLIGRLCDEPYFNKRKDGTEFGCSFTLAVKRNYKNKEGKYEADFVPVRFDGEKRMKFAHMLTKGDAVVVAGAITTKHYTKNGEEIYTIFVQAENISFCIGNAKKKASETKADAVMETDDLPELPY